MAGTIHGFWKNTGTISKAYNARITDIVTPVLKNNMSDAWANFTAWINAGYVLYDVIAEGGLSRLDGFAEALVLCVFQSCKPQFLDTPETGTAQTGSTTTTVIFESGASAVEDYYNGMNIKAQIYHYPSGYLEERNTVIDYDGATRTATVAKIWGGVPDSDYEVGGYDEINAADVSTKTEVVISGLYLYGQGIIGHTLEYRLGIDNNSKIKLAFIEATFAGAIKGSIEANFCKINFLAEAGWGYVSIPYGTYNEYIITGTSDSTLQTLTNANGAILENCIIDISGYSPPAVNGFYICCDAKNIFIKSKLTSTLNFYTSIAVIIENIYIDKCLAVYGIVDNSNSPVIYVDEISDTFVSDCNVAIRSLPKILNEIVATDEVDLEIETLLDLEFAELDGVLVSTTLEEIRLTSTAFGRRYYQLAFGSAAAVADEFKTMFARNEALLVVDREDLADDWVEGLQSDTPGAWILKNGVVYEHDGTTLVDYRNNEHFFILAKDASDNYGVFCWHDGAVKKSTFTEFDPTAVYTVEMCFQLFEPPEKVTWRNGTEEYPADTDGSVNAPIEFSSDGWLNRTSVELDQR